MTTSQQPLVLCAYVNDPKVGGQAPFDTPAMAGFADLVGRKPRGIQWYDHRDADPGFPAAQCDAVRAFGAAPILSFNHDGCSMADLAAGKDDGFYAAWARGAAAWGHTIYLRWCWEMNGGDWIPYSPSKGAGYAPADFVAAWRHLRGLFAKAGAANVKWYWCPNVAYNGSIDMKLMFPGNAYIDAWGLDGYNVGHADQWHWWTGFTALFLPGYQYLTSFILPSKIGFIGEVGCAPDDGGSKAAWLTSMLTVELPGTFPLIRAVTLFNQDKSGLGGFERDWRVNSAADALAATKAALASTYTPPAAPPPAIALYGGGLP